MESVKLYFRAPVCQRYAALLFTVIPISFATSFCSHIGILRGLVFYFLFSIMLIISNQMYMKLPMKQAGKYTIIGGAITGLTVGIICAVFLPTYVDFPYIMTMTSPPQDVLAVSRIYTVFGGLTYGTFISASYAVRSSNRLTKNEFYIALYFSCVIGYHINTLYLCNHMSDTIRNLFFSFIVSMFNMLAFMILFHELNPCKVIAAEFRESSDCATEEEMSA